MIRMFLSGTSGNTRFTACCRNEPFPSKVNSCLGVFSRLKGQNRSPLPPAIMITNRSFGLVLVFIRSRGLSGVRKRFHEPGDAFDQVRRFAMLGNLVDDCAADDDGLGLASDGAGLFRIRNAEANRNW